MSSPNFRTNGVVLYTMNGRRSHPMNTLSSFGGRRLWLLNALMPPYFWLRKKLRPRELLLLTYAYIFQYYYFECDDKNWSYRTCFAPNWKTKLNLRRTSPSIYIILRPRLVRHKSIRVTPYSAKLRGKSFSGTLTNVFRP